MALDKDYFDSISIELVKKKYYNAAKVRAVLDDIRIRARELNEENRQLRQELDKLSGSKAEIGDSVISAQQLCREMTDNARAQAEEILSEARRQSEKIIRDSVRRQDYALKCVEQCISRLREIQQNGIDCINLEWQTFLCGLDNEDEDDDAPEEEALQVPSDSPLPFSDLGEKLSGINEQIDSINNEDT